MSLDDLEPSKSGFVLDQSIVNEFYAGDEKKHAKLHKKLSNSTEVTVVFPELAGLTKRFCSGVDDFCQTISAPLFRDALKKKSTIDDYYKDFHSGGGQPAPADPTHQV